MSVNQRRTKRMSRSSTNAFTSPAVCGWSAMELLVSRLRRAPRLTALRATRGVASEPVARPDLERPDGGFERAALRRQAVLHADRNLLDHATLDDALALELL